MAATEVKIRVPLFPDIEAVKTAQRAKREQSRVDLYPRDGSICLFQLERQIAQILRVEPNHLLLYNTGMSAATDALEVSRPAAGTRILQGYQQYSQTRNYISDDLQVRGAEIHQVDVGSLQDIDRVVAGIRPDIVFFETVTNGSEMTVLDVAGFLKLPILSEVDPLIILDNTLPSSTVLPLGEVLALVKRKVIVIESGTKYMGLNSEMCGILYTYDEELLGKLKRRRQRTGSLLSSSAVETIREIMSKTAEEYDYRNRLVFNNTLRLARACSEAQQDLDDFVISHPNLPTHTNFEYANQVAPDGISPVFFILPTSGEPEGHYKIADRLWGHPVISRMCELGQSFGFDHTRIWPDDNSPVVRVSGGVYAQKDQAELERAFYEVLA